MIEPRDGRLMIKAPLVMANARGLLEAGRAVLAPGTVIFDFSEAGDADSSALAVMLGWLRMAPETRSTVTFANVPPGVRSLADLYGMTELFSLV